MQRPVRAIARETLLSGVARRACLADVRGHESMSLIGARLRGLPLAVATVLALDLLLDGALAIEVLLCSALVNRFMSAAFSPSVCRPFSFGFSFSSATFMRLIASLDSAPLLLLLLPPLALPGGCCRDRLRDQRGARASCRCCLLSVSTLNRRAESLPEAKRFAVAQASHKLLISSLATAERDRE